MLFWLHDGVIASTQKIVFPGRTREETDWRQEQKKRSSTTNTQKGCQLEGPPTKARWQDWGMRHLMWGQRATMPSLANYYKTSELHSEDIQKT
jgi:hypothetical protein